MSTANSLPIISPAPIPAPLAPQSGRVADSECPDSWHTCYKMKLSGLSSGAIAKRMGICRTQVWRRCKAVETEFLQTLEATPILNIISEEIAKLSNLEAMNYKLAEETDSSRAKSLFLTEARRVAGDRRKLLQDVGILPHWDPEKIYRKPGDMKPAEVRADENQQPRSKEAMLEEILEILERTPVIPTS